MSSVILRTATKLIVPLALLFSLFMAIKGHNEPGGGFIGGLIAAVGLVLYRMAEGQEKFMELMRVHPRQVLSWGLIFALGVGLIPLGLGLPFLTTYHGYWPLPMTQEQVHVASALVFDAGVFLVVVGASVGMVQRLSEELGT